MKKIFKLEDLDCANCAAKMEAALAKVDGVEHVSVNFFTGAPVLKFKSLKLIQKISGLSVDSK